MSDDEETSLPAGARPRLSGEDKSAIWWLAKWIGLPLAAVVALFYAEPWIRGDPKVEVVPSVLRQEVRPYPFPPGAKIPSLAPPEVPRAPRPELLPSPTDLLVPQTSAEIAASPIAQPQPKYPQRALEAEKEGIVRLRITIAPDGSVSDATVVNAQPKGWFDSAALSAVRRWRYQPSGRTISTEVEIEFKLN